MASWFKTRKEANAELKKRKEKAGHFFTEDIWKWTHTKRQKPFFVGCRIDWLNK